MKVLLLVSALVSASLADSCDNSFGAYLNSLKSSIDSDGVALDTEFRDDYYKLCRQCFASSSDDSSKCYLPDDELKGDVYSDAGPLKGCSRCQTMAKGFHDKFMNSQDSVRACFRKHFSDAVREELEPCIQGKISNGYSFKVPNIPDFDEKAFGHKDITETGINYRIVARSRMDVCAAVNPAKAQVTQPCMDKGFSGIYSKHCSVSKAARSGISSSCSSRFDEVKKATCQCMDEKRADWHQRFSKIQDIVTNAQSAKQCGDDISAVVGNWLGKLQSALNNCLPSNVQTEAKTSDLHTLIELGCGQVINGGVKKNELTVGFRFIRLLLDAMNDRLTIYCDQNCKY